MNRSLVLFLATGAYAGRSPVMPGTVGTLWGVLIGFFSHRLPLTAELAVFIVIAAAAVHISGQAASTLGQKDPSCVIVDEISGFLATLILLPQGLPTLILAFLLFRFFDILKPYPIRAVEKALPGGFGIVFDDIVAGLYANLSARLIIWLTDLNLS